jgi:hypothetical protein
MPRRGDIAAGIAFGQCAADAGLDHIAEASDMIE